MNWTGGCLQRHSKANTNVTLKAQKQHFAKARLQQQNGQTVPSPLHFPTFKVPLTLSDKVDRDPNRGVKRQRSPEAAGASIIKESNYRATDSCSASYGHVIKHQRFDPQPDGCHDHSNARVEAQDPIEERSIAAGSKAQQDSDKESRKSAQAETNTLDAVKRDLLRRSDWMGLTTARPLHMKFPSAQELENIGRRRKITREDRKRQEGAQTGHHRYPAPDPVSRHRWRQHQSDEMQVEGASIRIGSNIHQSQTTPMHSLSRKPPSVICDSESSESMLLDKEVSTCHQSVDIASSPKTALPDSRGSIKPSRRTTNQRSLVPLEQVRDSESFDQVMARSDSVSKRSLGDLQQRPSTSLKRRAANRSLASEEVKSSSIVVGCRLLQSTPSHSEDSNLQTKSKKQRQRPVSGENVEQPAPGSLSSDFSPPARGCNYNHEGRLRSSSDGIHRVPFNSFLRRGESEVDCLAPDSDQNQLHDRPKFTLELQVEADAQAAKMADASTSDYRHPDGIVTKHHENHSLPWIHPKLADGVTDRIFGRGDAVREGQQSESTGIRPALASTKHPDAVLQNHSRSHLEPAQSSRSPGRTTRREVDSRSITPSSTVLQVKKASQNRSQLGNGNPIRQRLGRFQQTGHEDDRGHIRAAQSDVNQAWMRFILQDDLSAISNNIYQNPDIAAHSARSPPQRWLRHRPSGGGTLSEDRELQSTQLQNQNSFSPVPTIRTTANTAIHEAESDLGFVPFGQVAPSETDFLSQLSPMEGQLDERLLNPSIYTNPARTERSYIAAPSRIRRRYGNKGHTVYSGQIGSDAHDSSPVHSIYDNSESQRHPIYGSPTPPSRSTTTTPRRSTDRKPLQPISNLFTDPRRSLVQPLWRPSDSSARSFQSPPIVVRASEQECLGGQWIDPPRSRERNSSAARRQINTFPLDYKPIRQATKKRRQEDPAAYQPPSSYTTTSQLGSQQTEIVNQAPHSISHCKISAYPPSSSHLSIPYGDTVPVADELTNSDHAHTSEHFHDQHDTATTPPILHPSYPSFATPPQALAPSPDHFIFTKPPPLGGPGPRTRTPAASFSAHPPMRKPVTPRQVEAFSTSRPMRKHLTPRRAIGTAFSTPRPVRSVLGVFKRPGHSVPVTEWGER